MDILRWGLLSTAKINQALIPPIRDSKRSELIAVASRTDQNAQDYADKWKIPLSFGSYQEMLDSGEIDAVYIGLPNHMHAEWTIKALDAGVNVLCEKPFAITLKQVDAVIEARERSSAAVAEAFMYRHHPQTRIVKEWIKHGKLGEITLVRGAFDFLMGEKGRTPGSYNVRMIPEFGGGCLWDVGIYPLSYTQFLLEGPPDWVFGSQQLGPTGIDEIFTGQMGYRTDSGEVLAQISSSFNTPFHTFMEIVGTKGRLHITQPFTNLDRNPEVIFTNHKNRSRKVRVPQKSLYLGEVEDMEKAALDGEDPLISLEETRNHIRTALALYKSARSGKIININEIK
jgi:predicted dehydrogenase